MYFASVLGCKTMCYSSKNDATVSNEAKNIRIEVASSSTLGKAQTNWGSIYVAAALTYVSAVQFSLYAASMFPYLQVVSFLLLTLYFM